MMNNRKSGNYLSSFQMSSVPSVKTDRKKIIRQEDKRKKGRTTQKKREEHRYNET